MKGLASIGAIFLFAWLASAALPLQAASPRDSPKPGPVGDPVRGRAIFNGMGGCYNCHGFDAFLSKRPKQSPKIEQQLARMNPPPADLRNPAGLRSRSETDRVLTLLKGHQGTAMFPKNFLTARERADLLEYLASLRGKGG